MKHLTSLVFSVFLIFGSLAAPSLLHADSTGEIVQIEDTTGTILPASEMCDNLLYTGMPCLPRAAAAFYAQYPDDYDILIFLTNKPLLSNSKVGYPLQPSARGIGMDTIPWHYSHMGSQGRLIQILGLGSLASLPDDPEDTYSWPAIKGVELVGHEIGHHWLTYVNVDHNDGRGERDILRALQGESAILHWSCRLNSDSVMYGGILTDNQDGTFTDTAGPRKFTYLDQYLMGLRAPGDVGPLWYVVSGYELHGCGELPPDPGETRIHRGTRVNFTVDDIIRVHGERIPAFSPCHLKVAFVLVYPPGLEPTKVEIEKVDRYRRAIEAWWPWATDALGSLDTRLDRCGTGTEACPGEQAPDCGETGCVEGETRCSGQAVVLRCTEGRWAFLEECGLETSCESGVCREDGSPSDGDETPDGDLPTVDGDEPFDGDVPIDGDAPEDGDEVPIGEVCQDHADCPEGTRCTSRGCAPCPDGQEFDGTRCQDLAALGGGGGCAVTGENTALLLAFLVIGLGVFRRAVRGAREDTARSV